MDNEEVIFYYTFLFILKKNYRGTLPKVSTSYYPEHRLFFNESDKLIFLSSAFKMTRRCNKKFRKLYPPKYFY